MRVIFVLIILAFTSILAYAGQADESLIWMKIKAQNRYERSAIANTGVTILSADEDHVVALGYNHELAKLEEMGIVEISFGTDATILDYPPHDSDFHNYQEMVDKIKSWEQPYAGLLSINSIGKSLEGRDIYALKISGSLTNEVQPAIVFMGGHHAREHLSVEMPLMLAEYLLKEYQAGNERVRELVNSREIHIIPLVNPDGAEHDIAGGNYKLWRKNRRNHGNGLFGVDLNRNYGYKWGTGGSSSNQRSDVYMGPKPFSEPETQAIKKYVDARTNISILLSFHTFSELILYPWGHSYNAIANNIDFEVHKKMAETMARWNGYKPQQASALYIASGDTTDWSYGEHGIISFTFELDPKHRWGMNPRDGFYAGQNLIPNVFRKNLEPSLYLIENAGNPRGVLQEEHERYGLSSALIQ